jgi:mRNA-degrading endonuclease RelE of RelBE toxin-antitoxin system
LAYDLIWHERVKQDLASLRKQDAARIIAGIKERLVHDPLGLSKPLKDIFKGLHRYRIGDTRIVFAIDHEKRRLIILHIKHRKNAYR